MLNCLYGDDLPEQLYPSPMNPARQVHSAPPGVLLQTARALQPPLFNKQGSVSTQTANQTDININNMLFKSQSVNNSVIFVEHNYYQRVERIAASVSFASLSPLGE